MELNLYTYILVFGTILSFSYSILDHAGRQDGAISVADVIPIKMLSLTNNCMISMS